MHPYLAEFIGTLMLILFGNGVVANVVLHRSKRQNSGWIVITWGWGLAVAMAVYTVDRFSGAHINPAVTIGLASVGHFSWSQVPGYVAAQLAGGFTGAVLVWLVYLAHWKETADAPAKLACFSTAPAIRHAPANCITEFIGTAVLVFVVLGIGSVTKGMSAVALEEGLKIGFGTWLGPLLVGLLVLGIGLSLDGPTGYAINPARDLGPRLAHALLPVAGKGSSDWSYAWIPVVAPVFGGVAGAWLFVALGM
ncbi:MAG TPA: MIP/aquaporin family protein [Opitutaceae bacterium]